MSKPQAKPGLGVKPEIDQIKVKKKVLGGRRVWVIIKRGYARGVIVKDGEKKTVEIGPGEYEAELAPHPLNPNREALEIESEEGPAFFISETFEPQGVDFALREEAV